MFTGSPGIGSGASGHFLFETGSTNGGASGDITLQTGNSSGTVGNIYLQTNTALDFSGYFSSVDLSPQTIGNAYPALFMDTTTPLAIASGVVGIAVNGNSAGPEFYILSVDLNSPSDTTNALNVQTGANAGAGGSGGVTIVTGPTTGGTSGSIILQIGDPGGGTRGAISFQDGSEGTAKQIWTSIDTAGAGRWEPAGTQSTAVRVITGAVTVTAADSVILINETTSATFHINLPTGVNGMSFQFSFTSAGNTGSSQYTFVTSGGNTLDGGIVDLLPLGNPSPVANVKIIFLSGVWYAVHN